jgi:hypothetical protein
MQMVKPLRVRKQRTGIEEEEEEDSVSENDDRKPSSNPSEAESKSQHADSSKKQRVSEEDTFLRVASSLLIDPTNAP